jgi:EmrB/QacA subfamily drug resistance transporter
MSAPATTIAIQPTTITAPTTGTEGRRWWALAVLCFTLVVIAVDTTIVNVALPTIQADLGASTSGLQWIVDAYVLVFAGLLLTFGSLGDRYGRKGALISGLVVIAGASTASAFAANAGQLIVTRALTGVGAALIMPATLSILTNVFTDPAERAKAIAIWSGAGGMGVALGPLAGGWLLERYWWGSVFIVNVPIVALALITGHRLVPTSRDPHAARIDRPGAVLSIAGIVALVWAIIRAGETSFTDTPVVAAFTTATALLVGFVAWERRCPNPMLDMRLFTDRRFSIAAAAVAFTYFALIGWFFLLTQYFQFVHGYSPLQAGLRLAPAALSLMAFTIASAPLVQRFGTRLVVSTGLALTATGLTLNALLLDAATSYPVVLAALILLAAGMAATMAPATDSIMSVVPAERAGVGSAVNDTTRELGGALGVAVIGSLASAHYAEAMRHFFAGPAAGAPQPVASAATHQLGAAVTIADKLGPLGRGLGDAARSAFMDGWTFGLLVAAAVALGAAIATVALLPPPARARQLGRHRPAVVGLSPSSSPARAAGRRSVSVRPRRRALPGDRGAVRRRRRSGVDKRVLAPPRTQPGRARRRRLLPADTRQRRGVPPPGPS